MSFSAFARRRMATSLLVASMASLALAGSVAAANPGDVTVSGASSSTIELAFADQTAAFGTNLSPRGATSDSADVVAAANTDDALGACYEIASSVTVSSNVSYDLDVQSDVANERLSFMTADPATYAACAGGVTTDPMVLAADGGATASQAHPYFLGLTVLWGAAPSATLGEAVLTFTVSAI